VYRWPRCHHPEMTMPARRFPWRGHGYAGGRDLRPGEDAALLIADRRAAEIREH
jgi:hypothetical protein